MIQGGVLHTGKVGHHAGDHPAQFYGPLLVRVTHQVDEGADAQVFARSAGLLKTVQGNTHGPAQTLGRAAYGETDSVPRIHGHANGFRTGAGNVHRHRGHVD